MLHIGYTNDGRFSYHKEVISMAKQGERKAKWLTDKHCKRAGEGTHFDASRSGLFLWVRNGHKNFYQSITIHGKRNRIAIGSYLMMDVEEARQKALDNLDIAKRGGDPRVPRNANRFEVVHQARAASELPIFRDMVDMVIKLKAPTWKDPRKEGRRWESDFKRFCYPQIGNKPVNEVTRADVKAILEPQWVQINAQMKKVRQRLSEVFKVAMVEYGLKENPADDAILLVLPKVNGKTKHHPFLPADKVRDAMERIRDSKAYIGTRLCLQFIILTAVRSKEAREAEWKDIDLEKGIWTIPAEKMKMARAHVVPLSPAAVSVLKKARKGFAELNQGLVFPSQGGRTPDAGILTRLLKREAIEGTDVHGFRSSFSSWANEQNYNHDAIEACLAHTTQGVRGAYMRGDFMEQRREIMLAWADCIM